MSEESISIVFSYNPKTKKTLVTETDSVRQAYELLAGFEKDMPDWIHNVTGNKKALKDHTRYTEEILGI